MPSRHCRLTGNLLLAVAAFVGSVGEESQADEGGGSFWQPGQAASYAAVLGDSGFSFDIVYFQRSGSISAERPIILGGNIAAGYSTTNSFLYLTPTYTFAQPVLGGQFAVSAALPVGREQTSISGTLSAVGGPTISATRSEALTALGDISPMATLKWARGPNDFMAYATVNLPTGYYSPTNIASIGLGRWAVDEGAAYTFLSRSGFEASITAGVTENFMNPSTQYQSGVDGHLDLGLSYSANTDGYVGVVGYVYRQLSADGGPAARLGPFESRVMGAGPQLGYAFTVGRARLDVNLRGYKEFEAHDRPEGWNAWLTVTVSGVRRATAGR